MNTGESKIVTGITATGTVGPFGLKGGAYEMVADGTFNSANVVLDQIAPDGAAISTGNTLSANGIIAPIYLPPGQFQFNVGTVTSVSVGITRIQL